MSFVGGIHSFRAPPDYMEPVKYKYRLSIMVQSKYIVDYNYSVQRSTNCIQRCIRGIANSDGVPSNC